MITYTNKQNLGNRLYNWNAWLGCYQKSEACQNCFIYSLNEFIDVFHLFPREFSELPSGTLIHVTLYSDFFLAEADKYRTAAWNYIKNHPNLIFLIITKRPERIKDCLPEDWGDGWDNVIFDITVENQKRVEERLPILLDLPCKHKWATCTPLLEEVDLSMYLKTGQIEHVELSGEKGRKNHPARPFKIEWAKKLKQQCVENNVRLSLVAAGHNCILEDDSVIYDDSTCYHSEIADSLNISYYKPLIFNLPDGTFTY